jgi:hypothetical protein
LSTTIETLLAKIAERNTAKAAIVRITGEIDALKKEHASELDELRTEIGAKKARSDKDRTRGPRRKVDAGAAVPPASAGD